MLQIVLADLSMSLDNVLAVAGVARDHPSGCSRRPGPVGRADGHRVDLRRAAARRLFWLSWVGLGIITFVALRMIWDGSDQIIEQTAALNIGF